MITYFFHNIFPVPVLCLLCLGGMACHSNSSAPDLDQSHDHLEEPTAEMYALQARKHLYSEWNWDSAGFFLTKSLELDSNQAVVHADYAWYDMLQGNPTEAISAIHRAMDLEPESPKWPLWCGWIHYSYQNYDSARLYFQSGLSVNPHPIAKTLLGLTLHMEGNSEEAAEWIKTANQDSLAEARLAIGYAIAGEKKEALRLIEIATARENPFEYLWVAIAYQKLGDRENAIQWLQLCMENRHDYLPWLQFYPSFDNLHDDPRFQRMVQELDLPVNR